MAKRSTAPKEKARKKVTVQIIPREHAGNTTGPYRIMDKLIEERHDHLREAKIAVAWRIGWKADADGRITLGSCKKGSAEPMSPWPRSTCFVTSTNRRTDSTSGWEAMPAGSTKCF